MRDRRRWLVIERVLNHAGTSAGPLAAVYQRYDYAKEKREALELWACEVVRIAKGDAARRNVFPTTGEASVPDKIAGDLVLWHQPWSRPQDYE
jgi:hypothetical protein